MLIRGERLEEVRRIVFARAGNQCQAPGCPGHPDGGVPQLAHVIPAWKWLYNKYGDEIIDHPENLRLALSTDCNKKIELESKSQETIEAHVAKIRARIEKEKEARKIHG